MSEMMGVQHRGKAVGLMQSGYAVGWALATSAFALSFSWLPDHYAWRALFFMGLLSPLSWLCIFRRRSPSRLCLYWHLHRRHGSPNGNPF